MPENNINNDNQNRYPVPQGDIIKMQLNSVKNTKNSMARIMRAYFAGQIEHSTFRNMIYAFSTLTNLHRLEKDIDIEKRIKELEEKINEQSKN